MTAENSYPGYDPNDRNQAPRMDGPKHKDCMPVFCRYATNGPVQFKVRYVGTNPSLSGQALAFRVIGGWAIQHDSRNLCVNGVACGYDWHFFPTADWEVLHELT